MEIINIDTAIIGGGVIGLATAAEISRKDIPVYVFESEKMIGSGISSRNSEVIHSGIYYAPDTLKSKLCVQGKKLLYKYCEIKNIPNKKCGKLIVATTENEVNKLEFLAKNAVNCGAGNFEIINQIEAKRKERHITCLAALDVCDTGIIDSHSFMSELSKDIQASGGEILLKHRCIEGVCLDGMFELLISGPDNLFKVRSRRLIISAGLSTHTLAAQLGNYDMRYIPELTFAKGSYFSFSGKERFNKLIYPAPVEGGLGTHLTFDLSGQLRFGPDVEWLTSNDTENLDYKVDPNRSSSFYEAIRRYWPELPSNSLVPAYSGIRPKLSRKGQNNADFLIDGPERHGIDNLLIMYGIESPGLTSSLAIAAKASKSINL